MAAAIVLQRLVLGPAVAGLAADYVTLPLGAGAVETLIVGCGLTLMSAIAVLVVTRSATREQVAAGLERDE